MKKLQSDKDWQNHLKPEIHDTYNTLHDFFPNRQNHRPMSLSKHSIRIIKIQQQRHTMKRRVATFFGTGCVISGTGGGLTILTFVLIQLIQTPTSSLSRAIPHSGFGILLTVLSLSFIFLGFTFIGYSMLQKNQGELERLDRITKILLIGIAATLIGAAVEISQGWIQVRLNPSFIVAAGILCGGIITFTSGSIIKLMRDLSAIRVALTGIILCIIGFVQQLLMVVR